MSTKWVVSATFWEDRYIEPEHRLYWGGPRGWVEDIAQPSKDKKQDWSARPALGPIPADFVVFPIN